MNILSTISAWNILNLLLIPWSKTQEFKMGLIDEKGNRLIAYKDMTQEQKSKFSPFRRIVFYLRKIMEKHPLISTALAYQTIKKAVFESQEYSSGDKLTEATMFFNKLEERLGIYYNVSLVVEDLMFVEDLGTLEEELENLECLAYESTVAGGAGIAGLGTEPPTPVVRSKNLKNIFRRQFVSENSYPLPLIFSIDHIRTLASWLEKLNLKSASKEMFIFFHEMKTKTRKIEPEEINARAMSAISLIKTYEKDKEMFYKTMAAWGLR